MSYGGFLIFISKLFRSDPGLESDLAAIVAKLDTLETALAGASTAAEVAALQAALTAAQEDISAILESNNVYTGDLNISNAAELAYATALGNKVAIINGNVVVTVSTANELSAAAVSAVTSKIASVVGSVTVSTNVSLDFSALTAVSGAYSVSGKDVADDALASAGAVSLSYTGTYSQPNLVSAVSVTLETSTVTTTTAVDFSGLTSGNINAGTMNFTSATTIDLGAGVAVISLTAPKALTVNVAKTSATAVTINTVSATSVVVGGTTALTGNLDVTAAGDVTLSALKTVGGNTNITAGDVTLSALTTVGGTTNITAGGDLSAPALTTLTGATTISAATVNAPALKTLTAAATISKASALSLPALTTVTTGLTAANVITFNAPVLAATAPITTVSATTYVLKSVSAIGDLASLATLESITLSEQAASLDFGAAAKLTSLNLTGKANTTDITIGNAPLLASVSLAGKLGTTVIEGGLAKLTTGVTTAGTIAALTISGTTNLTAASLNHTEDATSGAQLTVSANAKLASLTTAVNRVTKFVVTNNPKLAAIDASSMVSMPVNSAASTVYTFDISGNSAAAATFAAETGLKGAYVAAVGATATAAATDAVYKQNSLLTVKPYLTLVMTAALATTPTATGTVSLDYVALSGTVNTSTQAIGTAGAITTALKSEVSKIAAE